MQNWICGRTMCGRGSRNAKEFLPIESVLKAAGTGCRGTVHFVDDFMANCRQRPVHFLCWNPNSIQFL